MKQQIGIDMLRVAHMYNNILYQKHYRKHGHYLLNDVKTWFGSFNKACRELQIVNPDDPWDLQAVLKDIMYVAATYHDISINTYREFGIYQVDALQKRYGKFGDLVILAGAHKKPQEHIPQKQKKKEPACMYPIYPRKHHGKHVALAWNKGGK